jgi:hypothetical protein
MNKQDTHPMYLVRDSIGNLLDAYLSSLKTPMENNPITEEERKVIHEHTESLTKLMDSFQQRIKQEVNHA